MAPQKILIVDDERPLSLLISEALEAEGSYVVDQAFDGREGIEKYKQFLPDLVIMDMNMPVMDGYESSMKIKSFDPSARILVLTGNARDRRAKMTLEKGFALTLLQKPLRLRELSRIIRESLPKNRK